MQIRRHESIPPSLEDKPIDPTSILEYITTHISAIYTTAKSSDLDDEYSDQDLHIDHDTYARIYTAVVDLSTATCKTSTADINRGTLYQFLNAEIQSYCKYIKSYLFGTDSHGTDEIAARRMLIKYLSCHRRLLRLSSLVKGLVRYWDRHWVRQQWGLKKIQVRSVEELHKVVWKEEILEKGGLEEVVDAVTVLRKSAGGMRDYDVVLVRDVVMALSGLGVTLES